MVTSKTFHIEITQEFRQHTYFPRNIVFKKIIISALAIAFFLLYGPDLTMTIALSMMG